MAQEAEEAREFAAQVAASRAHVSHLPGGVAKLEGVDLFPMPTRDVLKKVALILTMRDEVRRGLRQHDAAAEHSLLDDPKVAGWLSAMQRGGHVVNDRYTYVRKG